MKTDPLNPASRQPDVPLSLALIVAVGFAALFFWLRSPRYAEWFVNRTLVFAQANAISLGVVAASCLVNIIGLGIVVSSARRRQRHDPRSGVLSRLKVPAVRIIVGMAFAAVVLAWITTTQQLSLCQTQALPFVWPMQLWTWGVTISLSFSVVELELVIWFVALSLMRAMSLEPSWATRLPKIRDIRDGIVLGAIKEDWPAKEAGSSSIQASSPEWIYLGLRALTGNMFISGAIGSGKSQILLRFLKQILSNFGQVPALLAIDPKRTFVRELRRIIEAQGLSTRLVWVSLDEATSTFKFNPIWQEGMLKRSGFTTIANSLKLASSNFLGGSIDHRFWEQSSFNLLKNALVFCAAKYDYFTFRELYRALVQARDEGLTSELVDRLALNKWDPEERANIQMAFDYFSDEFMQMDQKLRTSILATATSFLNEFLEYRVSRILSPKREEINLHSMKDAIRDGKLICLYVENDALARSIGTLLKLLYQEAVLERVNDPGHEDARYAVLVMDEYQDVATTGGGAGLGDDRYLAKGRESKAITIAATQSVSSLENAVRSEPATREILQNFRTRIFGNSTDPKTIRLFQEPHGTVERERQSHNFSENARARGLEGLWGSEPSSISQGVSTHLAVEYPITAREFSRLRAFEAYAQIFDGLETRFEKLFLKPHFLSDMRTAHRKIMKEMQKAARVPDGKAATTAAMLAALAGVSSARADVLFPNVCSALKSPSSSSCIDFQVSGCKCGIPPHPCAQISYDIPQTFIEVWPQSNDTFFGKHPAGAQLLAHNPAGAMPFGTEDDWGNYTFQARAIPVPLAGITLGMLPCGGTRNDKPCFDLMSEDIGRSWSDGSADSLQPQFLAWQLSPKLCLIKGAAQSFVGEVTPSLGSDSGACSYPIGTIPKYPPSPRETCNGWGIFYPRSGVYQGASRSAAALMIASRLKSIGTEVIHTIPGDADEKWQMLYPQSSSCFREGQNLGFLETIGGLREESRIFGKPNGYLFLVWKRVSCCREIAEAPAAMLALEAMRAACQAMPGGM